MRSGKAPKTVDDYLAGVPEPAASTLKHIRAVIRSVVPKETTEVISYGIPMFKLNGMLVGYAAFAKHCSLFPTGSGVIEQFAKDLKGYSINKGTIRFQPDKPLPDALIKKIVRARVKENREWD
ncbi:MAG: iron chaperone [Candidatus Sulfotelmatobacter sp.]